jgi:gamma-glutamyltranspeptidase/glutathione hydrolase
MKGIISAGDKKTAFAGGEILKNGGNSYDALAASVFAAHICEPALTSPAGGGFVLTNKNDYEFWDFFVNVPMNKPNDEVDFYPILVDFGSTVQPFHIGCASIAVPGVMKGILELQSKFGKLSLEDVLSPVINLAENGVYLTEFQVYVLSILEPIFLKYEDSRKIFSKNGKLITSSDLFTNKEYANFLKKLSKEDVNIFYQGEIADVIENLSISNNGLIRKADLLDYKTNILNPIKFQFGKYQIITSPPPSLGGLLINFTLNLVESVNMSEFGSYEHLFGLISAMKMTQDFRKKDLKKIISNDNINFKYIPKDLMTDYLKSYLNLTNFFGNTTHISIIDEENNIVSCTSSNGEGSGLLIPDTGIMLNNMLGEEDLNPEGFFKWESGIRLPSMMSPTIILKDDEPVLILGSSGSNRIRSALIQTLMNYLIYDFDVEKAVENPRIHFEDDKVYVEPGFAEKVVSAIEKEFETVRFDKKNLFFGGVQAVTGDMQGASDLRREGYTLYVK